MELLVLIPALNEEMTISDVIGRIPREIDGVDLVNVAVVDDGSTDRTAELAEGAGAHVIGHRKNMGVGAAFQTGVEYAITTDADLMVNMDGDGQFSPEDIPLLIRPLLDDSADVVTASRFKKKEYWPEMNKVKFYGNRGMSALISFLVGKKYYDVSCGFRAYKREVLLQMNLFGQFTYTQETFLDLSYKDLEIREIPVRIRGTREFGKSRVASNLFKYALQTTKIILRSFRDYKPMVVFGLLSMVFFLAGTALGTFLLTFYIMNGTFSPHKWAGFVSGAFLVLGTLIFIAGMQADMLGRMRRNQERILYLLKKRKR